MSEQFNERIACGVHGNCPVVFNRLSMVLVVVLAVALYPSIDVVVVIIATVVEM